jgi:Skp family chaperone for outer membrane proteins
MSRAFAIHRVRRIFFPLPYRSLQAEQALEDEKKAREQARRKLERERQRKLGQQAMLEKRRKDGIRRRRAQLEHERTEQRGLAFKAEVARAARESRQEHALRRARQHEEVLIHTTRICKAMCLAELKARVLLRE